MRLMYPIFSDPILFEENKINVLIIENGAFLAKFIQDFSSQLNGVEGSFVFSEDFKIISISKHLEFITDVFSLDINNRKITGKMLEELSKLAMNEDNYMKTLVEKQNLIQYIGNLCLECEYSLIYDEKIDLSQLFKVLKVEIQKTESISELLLEYFSVMTKLFGTKCFVVLNLKSFLAQEDLSLFYQEVRYRKYNLLMLESYAQQYMFPFEKIRIIDRDLCELKINH